MWLEGLIAIVGFNICLLVDYLTVNDSRWLPIMGNTALVTPVALVVNMLVRSNPPRAIREGGVACGMLAICFINIVVEGQGSSVSTLFGVSCIMITAMFAGIVMRLRYQFTLPTLAAMFVAGVWSLGHSAGLRASETIIGDSMLAVGIAIIAVASISLEREERNSYLIALQHNLQAEELAWANQALQDLSNIDILTHLPNRRALDERVALLWQSCAERNEPLSAVVIDVDHFKQFNDTHGHLFGDEILRHIGALLTKALRSDEDMAARFGGEEFVLVLPGAMPQTAMEVAENVRHLVETTVAPSYPLPSGQSMAPIAVSCGVSTLQPGDVLLWNDLIAAADEALYLAKRSGRNRVEFSRCMESTPATAPAVDRSAPRINHGSRTISKGRLAALGLRNPDNPISKIIARI